MLRNYLRYTINFYFGQMKIKMIKYYEVLPCLEDFIQGATGTKYLHAYNIWNLNDDNNCKPKPVMLIKTFYTNQALWYDNKITLIGYHRNYILPYDVIATTRSYWSNTNIQGNI